MIALGIAVVGCFLLFATWELSATNRFYTHETDQAADDYHDRSQERIRDTCTNREIAPFSVCVSEILKSTQEAQTAQYDLSAQNRMALWAQWSFFISVFSLGITGVGIYFVWKTLDANIEAVKTANRAIESDREIGEAQMRAYITVMSGFTAKPAPGENKIVVYLRMTNSGQSPAFNLQIENKVIVVNQPLALLPPFEPMDEVIDAIPNGEFRDTVVPIEVPDFFRRMAAGEVVTYCYGVIKYRDVFKAQRSTRYRLVCRYHPEMGGFLFGPDGDGIQMT